MSGRDEEGCSESLCYWWPKHAVSLCVGSEMALTFPSCPLRSFAVSTSIVIAPTRHWSAYKKSD